jgi:hypothetical protein
MKRLVFTPAAREDLMTRRRLASLRNGLQVIRRATISALGSEPPSMAAICCSTAISKVKCGSSASSTARAICLGYSARERAHPVHRLPKPAGDRRGPVRARGRSPRGKGADKPHPAREYRSSRDTSVTTLAQPHSGLRLWRLREASRRLLPDEVRPESDVFDVIRKRSGWVDELALEIVRQVGAIVDYVGLVDRKNGVPRLVRLRR